MACQSASQRGHQLDCRTGIRPAVLRRRVKLSFLVARLQRPIIDSSNASLFGCSQSGSTSAPLLCHLQSSRASSPWSERRTNTGIVKSAGTERRDLKFKLAVTPRRSPGISTRASNVYIVPDSVPLIFCSGFHFIAFVRRGEPEPCHRSVNWIISKSEIIKVEQTPQFSHKVRY